MNRLRLTRPIALTFAVAILGVACHPAAPDAGLAGTWVLALEDRPFMVLTLRAQGASFGGTFNTAAWTTSDGLRFTDIRDVGAPRPITKASVDGATIHISVEDPGDKAHPDEFDVVPTDADHAALTMSGLPFPPWTLARHVGAAPVIPTDWDRTRTYAVRVPSPPPNPEMTAIYAADQKDRQGGEQAFNQHRSEIAARDTDRRKQTKALLEAGALKAGEDYRRAAFVFQHGTTPADYLLAHTLATIALTKSDAEAGWIAAASLDRYLRSIHKPVIFGTGFVEKGGTLVAEEPFDRTVLSEDLRRALGVRPVAEWADRSRAMMQGPPAPSAAGK